MSERIVINSNKDEIDLRELFRVIMKGKWIILIMTMMATSIAAVYAQYSPDIYKTEITLVPAEDSGLKVPGQLGGLAALAGVNLGNGASSRTFEAIEILKSRDFLGRFIEDNKLYVPIVASYGWDRDNNKLLVDPDIYDEKENVWVREVQPPLNKIPSLLETYEKFTKLLTVNQDQNSGIIKITIEHYSPKLAQQWAKNLVVKINEHMRDRELYEAEQSISYLEAQVRNTDVSDIKIMLYGLIEEQTKKVMLANVRDEYAFKIIDSAYAAEQNVRPNRFLIIVIGFFSGFIISVFISGYRNVKYMK